MKRTLNLLYLFLVAGCLQAGLIAINNPSFETVTNNANTAACVSGGVLKDNFFIDSTTTFGFGNGCVDSNPAPGWSFSIGNSSGVQRFTTNFSANANSDGGNTAYSNAGSITQTLVEILRIGTYTLQVDIGNRSDTPFLNDYTISLLAGGTPVGSHTNFISPARGTYATDTLTINTLAGNPLLGQTLGIRLSAGQAQAQFDNVRLDGPVGPVSAVPEPSMAGLLLTGLGTLLAWTRYGGRRINSATQSL